MTSTDSSIGESYSPRQQYSDSYKNPSRLTDSSRKIKNEDKSSIDDIDWEELDKDPNFKRLLRKGPVILARVSLKDFYNPNRRNS